MAIFLFLSLCGSVNRADEPANPPASDKATLEKQLAEKLTHCRLIGFYETIGQEGPPKQDEYTLEEVQKKDGDKWVFNASLQFGSKVINMPLEVPILWAGDTPVVSVTDLNVPGMGTYTARVMFYGDHYAGTWSSAKHGGYLWGRIQKLPEHQDKPVEKPAKG
jgi:hypothetical protein